MSHTYKIENYNLPRFFCFLIFALTLLSYSNSLYSPFVLDDFHSFILDPHLYVKNPLSLESLEQLSNTKFGINRIVPIVTFAIDHHLAKNIVQYHLTNITILLLTGLAVFFFTTNIAKTDVVKNKMRAFSPFTLAVVVTGLWILSPIQTSAITYIVQRMAALCGLFYISTLASYTGFRLSQNKFSKTILLICTLSFTILAFLSKENSFTLPFLIIITEAMFISPNKCKDFVKKIPWFNWLILLFLFVLIFPIISSLVSPRLSFDTRHFDMIERLFTETRIVIFYITLLAFPWPQRMNLEHNFNISEGIFAPFSTFLSLVLILVIIAFAFRNLRDYPLISYGIFFFFLNLIIESTIFPLELIFEHRLYLPSVGFFIVIACLLDKLIHSLKKCLSFPETYIVFSTFFVMILSILSILTTMRNHDWRSIVSIHLDSLQKAPNKPRILTNYGVALGMSGKCEEAIPIFQRALDKGIIYYENYIDSASNIVLCLSRLGEKEEAAKKGNIFFKNIPEAINLRNYTKFVHNLSTVNSELNNHLLAYEFLKTGLKVESYKSNNFLVNSLGPVLDKAYDDPEYRQKLSLNKTGNKQKDVLLKIIQTLLSFKDYGKAKTFIKKYKEKFSEDKLINSLNDKYESETTKNQNVEANMKIINHLPFQKDLFYKWVMRITDFINNKYPPLHSTIGWFLNHLEKKYQRDPYITVKKIQWLIDKNKIDKAFNIMEKNFKLHNDFIPFLEIAGNLYRAKKKKEKAIKIYSKILRLYPGTPKRIIYERFITNLNKS